MGLALLALSLIAKAAPAPLMPTGPWSVRAEKNRCLLERDYALGDGKISLVFQQSIDRSELPIFVIIPGQSGPQYRGNFSAGAMLGAAPFTGHYFSVVISEANARVTRLSAEPRMLDELKDEDTLRIQAEPVDQSFSIKDLVKARVALQSCVDDLKKAWGIDPEIIARAVAPAQITGNPAQFFGPRAYPREALKQRIAGRVVTLLDIDLAGTVATCRVVLSEGPSLDEGTCAAAKRIRFKPARDKDGQPLPYPYVLPVRWVLPGSPK